QGGLAADRGAGEELAGLRAGGARLRQAADGPLRRAAQRDGERRPGRAPASARHSHVGGGGGLEEIGRPPRSSVQKPLRESKTALFDNQMPVPTGTVRGAGARGGGGATPAARPARLRHR